jgi:hypothetical protein
MTLLSGLQLILYLVVLLALAKPLGTFMARVYQWERIFLDRVLEPIERLIYRVAGIRPEVEMNCKVYALAAMTFNLLSLLVVYALQRWQAFLPLSPQGLGAVTPDSSWNTAVSFATNTNWQGYGGEVTMGVPGPDVGLSVQNFVSAATGMAVLAAFIRGIARHTAATIGNFWVDLTRSTLYILLPLSLLVALALISQGVAQTLAANQQAVRLQPTADPSRQVLLLGTAASQVAIRQPGTNGCGFPGLALVGDCGTERSAQISPCGRDGSTTGCCADVPWAFPGRPPGVSRVSSRGRSSAEGSAGRAARLCTQPRRSVARAHSHPHRLRRGVVHPEDQVVEIVRLGAAACRFGVQHVVASCAAQVQTVAPVERDIQLTKGNPAH